MWEIVGLISLIIFHDEAALIHFANRGTPLLWTFFFLSLGSISTTLIIYFLSGPKGLARRMHYPAPMIEWLARRRVMKSYWSYRRNSEETERRIRKRIIASVLKVIYALGYVGIGLAAMVPLPAFRIGAILATRVANLRHGLVVIIGVAEVKLLLETMAVYYLGKTIPFLSKIALWHLIAFFFGGSILYTLIGWFRHALTDNHFSRGRFV